MNGKALNDPNQPVPSNVFSFQPNSTEDYSFSHDKAFLHPRRATQYISLLDLPSQLLKRGDTYIYTFPKSGPKETQRTAR